jgi:hypothetical protein
MNPAEIRETDVLRELVNAICNDQRVPADLREKAKVLAIGIGGLIERNYANKRRIEGLRQRLKDLAPEEPATERV